jgi:hypothetical protein
MFDCSLVHAKIPMNESEFLKPRQPTQAAFCNDGSSAQVNGETSLGYTPHNAEPPRP